MTTPTAAVIGAGIGGLAAGIGLARRGWAVTVYERAPELIELGTGISLWNNAFQALDDLGVGDAVRSHTTTDTHLAGIRNRRGRWLQRADPVVTRHRLGEFATLYRRDLLRTLAEEFQAVAGEGSLILDTRVSVMDADGRISLTSTEATGVERRVDLVVAADGISSRTRRALWHRSRPPDYAGYTAWRWVTIPLKGDWTGPGYAAEVWGRGQRVGFLPLPDGRYYCFATVQTRAGGLRLDLSRLSWKWADPVPRLVNAADPDSVLRHDIYDLPDLDTFVSGKVALLGDAAHAMTPNLGQGACQALEDAAVLARAAPNLEAYDRARRPRAQQIAARSRLVGEVGQWSTPLAVALRDRALRLMPQRLILRQSRSLVHWSPPLDVA